VLAILLALVVLAATPDPTHVAAELANCHAQRRPECPTETPQPTAVPRSTPTVVPSETPVPTETPVVLVAFAQSNIPEGTARQPVADVVEAAPAEEPTPAPTPTSVVAVPQRVAPPAAPPAPAPTARVVVVMQTVVVTVVVEHARTVVVVATATPKPAAPSSVTPRPSPGRAIGPSPSSTTAPARTGSPVALAIAPRAARPTAPSVLPVNWDWGGFFRASAITLAVIGLVVLVFTRRRVVTWRSRDPGGS
jgi:hypothetical protein